MELRSESRGHLAALITVIFWGITYVSTKSLLEDFSPVEILFIRFVIGYAALWLICPRILKIKDRKQHIYFAAAGFCGVTLYYLIENIALTYTLASNVGIILAMAPFFTAIFGYLFLKNERPGPIFFIGFIIAMTGIFLIGYNTEANLKLNPLGDILAVIASVVWAAYTTLSKKISSFGYDTTQSTKTIFTYGLIFMLPVVFLTDFNPSLSAFVEVDNLVNILFLGLGASAMCFVTWNFALKVLGSVKTSVYIYLVPVITTVSSAIILGEQITGMIVCGIILTLAGLVLSERKKTTVKEPSSNEEAS
ncbi:DMT family transporter [Candidatus Methanomassiliicoccus intestinalis]|uniref:DMT family transporter n=1 Tax=Candidatus Methanomassiliicoccus intestinalis TaxID=1406512 RepID=UPI0037DDBF57